MANFDRFDIAAAHCVLEWDYNMGGWLQERPSNQRRMEATAVQLRRLGYRPSSNLCFETLSENAQEIYLTNALKQQQPFDERQALRMEAIFGPNWRALTPS